MRNISASLTTNQIVESARLVALGKAPVKDVTRRLGWKNLKVGERLQVCKKCMGRKPGEPLEKLAVIEVVSVRREQLALMMTNPVYGRLELKREGFREVRDFGEHFSAPVRLAVRHPSPRMFVSFFCATHKGCQPATMVTRIEFKYVR